MTERPILFSGPMVRKILVDKKTNTRRVAKHIPALGAPEDWCHRVNEPEFQRIVGDYSRFCPYGVPGDMLWVREAWALEPAPLRVVYQAGGERELPVGHPLTSDVADRCLERRGYVYVDGHGHRCIDTSRAERWTPSIHMPRWASRITLEVVSVRVERLQAITPTDVWAEGLDPASLTGTSFEDYELQGRAVVRKFAELWDSINGARAGCSWSDNPWVWRIEFRRVGP